MNTKFLKDLAERVFWTAAEGGLSVITVESMDIPKSWIVLIAAVLAMIKGIVAKHVGNSDSASTVSDV